VSKPARARHRPTAAAVVPLLLSALMFGLALLTGNSWFLLLGGAAIGVFGLGTTSRAQINDLTLSWRHEGRVAVGEELAAVLQVRNTGGRCSSAVSMHVRTTGLADVTVYVGSLVPGESAEVATRQLAVHRGVTGSTQVELTSSPSLGFVRAYLHRDVASPLTIHPEQLAVAVDASTRHSSYDAEGNPVRGLGTEPFGLREWRHGDDHRHVHWRSTARHGRLVVLERGETPVSALRLVLVGPSGAPDFERALAEAAAVCDMALRTGQPVTAAAWLPGGAAVARVDSRLELLDWWSALTDVVLPDTRQLGRTIAAVFGSGDVLVAGAASLDSWLAGAQAAGAPLRRLEVRP
jgi:uncharacterized protein (DUF58 family)